jgi:hypothetical protein
MEIVLLLLLCLALLAISALILAWPMLYAVNYLAHIKPLFWHTFQAAFLASLLGLITVPVVLLPLGLVFGLDDPERIPTILIIGLYIVFYAAYFRLFLKMPDNKRICYKHSMIVSLIPTMISTVFGAIGELIRH